MPEVKTAEHPHLSNVTAIYNKMVERYLETKSLSKIRFSDIRDHISANSMSVLDSLNHKYLTPIQAQSLCSMLAVESVDLVSKTGTGKTLAYILPLFEVLAASRFKHTLGTGAIVLAPTRELCTQIHDVAKPFAKKHSRSCVILVSGSGGFNNEQRKLTRCATVIIATPGRLLQHLEQSRDYLRFNVLVTLVLDEADRMVKDGFTDQLRRIMLHLHDIGLASNKLHTGPSRHLKLPQQLVTATATATNELNAVIGILKLHEQRRIYDLVSSDHQRTNSTLKQTFMVVNAEDRCSVLGNLLRRNRNKKIMVFLNACDCAEYHRLLLGCAFGLKNTLLLTGHMEQKERRKIFFKFCKSTQTVLFCTDVTARGLDVKGVDLVVLYDAPYTPEDYVHRVGRTARGGSSGRSILFLRPSETQFATNLQNNRISLKEQSASNYLTPNNNEILLKCVEANDYLKSMGINAFRTYLRSYSNYPDKQCFPLSNLDFNHVSTAFGLRQRPDITGLGLTHLRNKCSSRHPAKRFKDMTANVIKFDSDDSS